MRNPVSIEDLPPAEVEALYRDWPERSKCRDADNPNMFVRFRKHVDPQVINFALLCKDKDRGSYTWHLHCGHDHESERKFLLCDLQDEIVRREVEEGLSVVRHRRLQIVEAYERFYGHLFLSEQN